jgi:hypothetical protein
VLGWLVKGGQNWEMEDAREGGGLKPDREPTSLACCMEIALEIFHIEF